VESVLVSLTAIRYASLSLLRLVSVDLELSLAAACLPDPVRLQVCIFKLSSIFGGVLSDWKPITASIVQGSGIGPCLFIVYTMDLKPHSSFNTILKYADDTTLLVPHNSSTTLETEFKFSHILEWSNENKLKVNTLKTKEIVFHRPRLPK